MVNQFSTLYLNESEKDLWGKKITEKSSLLKDQEKYAYSTFYYFENNKLIKTECYPSLVINKENLSYDNAHSSKYAKELNHFTNQLTSINDYHDLVSYWMVLTNQTIGKKFFDSDIKIPYRINSKSNSIKNSSYDNLSEDIRKKFISKI